MHIYHVVMPEAWDNAVSKPFYQAESLESEGFIHCSSADQLDGVIERYYANAGELVILSIDPNKLTSTLVSEPSTNNEPFPHIYGPINAEAIIKVETRRVGNVPQQDQ